VTAPSWAQFAADNFDPPPPDPDVAGPVSFAEAHSRGQYRRYRHVEVIERAILDTIATGGRLILSASVRHGKSQTASLWFPAWYLGTHPDNRVILAGHEADFAARWGRGVRDILIEHGHRFGVAVSKRSEAANRWDLERPHSGGMLTVGVGGSPIGRGADCAIVDDPCKSYEDAMSPLKRQRLIEWWTGTMASRIEPHGAVILIMARWHENDLAGFLLREAPEQWRELRLPAVCDDPDNDPMGRAKGEPLWPERWPAEALAERRREVSLSHGETVWQAQFQQRPMPPGGGMFPERQWRFVGEHEVPDNLQWVRGWDLAATEDAGDWTVGARMARLPDDRFAITDVVRGQWDSRRVRHEILAAARRDPKSTRIELPQDPGQAGKDQAQQLASLLAGFNVKTRPVSGAKDVRATGYAAQQQAGNVALVEAPWNGAWVAEHAGFPRGTHDDQVDTGSTAFNVLAGNPGPPRARWM
jgi:predicted phage terminase large subunit-like protein